MDKEPSAREVAVLWTHFDSKCAYCGMQLARAGRTGHLDHLEASRSIGRNHISNRVLACNICNGDEKREADWEHFLALKCGADEQAHEARRERILQWRAKCKASPTIDGKIIAQVQQSVEACNALLENESKRIKQMLADVHRKQLCTERADTAKAQAD
ncbi:MAG TPA: HNH endonuclease signature motif containing protein [Verrucomicrobiae bacterium]|nr:HNH endonuclease signature motif containing protein [Verrucomicrobiae bacterium]